MRYDKLVRDRIPEIIRARGADCETRTLSPAEYRDALRRKLTEEVGEYLESGALEELADILEVLRALAEMDGHTPDELEAARADKARERGGFADRILLIGVDEAENSDQPNTALRETAGLIPHGGRPWTSPSNRLRPI